MCLFLVFPRVYVGFSKVGYFGIFTWFNRRAVEDDLLDTNRVVQIGLRGSGYEPGEVQWNRDQVHLVTEEDILSDLILFNHAEVLNFRRTSHIKRYTAFQRHLTIAIHKECVNLSCYFQSVNNF